MSLTSRFKTRQIRTSAFEPLHKSHCKTPPILTAKGRKLVATSRKPMRYIVFKQTKGPRTDSRILVLQPVSFSTPSEASVRPERQRRFCRNCRFLRTITQKTNTVAASLRMLPLPSHGLFFLQYRHHVGSPVLHHVIDDVDQAAHDVHQRLLLGLALGSSGGSSRGIPGCGASQTPWLPAPVGWPKSRGGCEAPDCPACSSGPCPCQPS